MPRVEWKGDQLAAAARQKCLAVARDTAEVIGGIAQNRAPLDKSPLRGSMEVTDIENGAEISFNESYAVVMHESQNYTPSHAGTGPNYLRGPLLENESKYHDDIAAALKGIWG